ncbi:c2h2 transcription factor [Grosmannia clavigera kw1407]|uniref:C2h2 transcription factor n=1 Tax=Grosmannia clavigera (strain kw1407 / UAMH 11150) TaxID=655863 RepID=F0XIP1_GROCL|nr:c2h2 transcription factor [Grosmannia clavigera kw1407]EFX02567.1 c2h2 transcription factor [Grosmannia clavigera kw1407]
MGCFPDYTHVNLFATLFFEHFDPILSIYNSRVAAIDKHWVLALAVIAVGSQYSGTVEMAQCVVPLHEFLRLALVSNIEGCDGCSGDDGTRLARAQALVINQVGMMYYGSRRLDRLARHRRAELADIATTTMRILAEKDEQREEQRADDEPVADAWRRWMVQEAWRRLGYTIWLLDCMGFYHFGQRPMLSLECTIRCDLPYDELWAAHTVEQWSLKYKSDDYNRHPSLVSSVYTLFRHRQRPSDLGEFSDLLLLHGIYEHIYQVDDYYRSPLSEWIPRTPPVSRRGAVNIDVAETASTIHSTINNFESWRSAAMDCVDVLHWAANGTVARLAGAEHATVLHLQFSRVVLWAPYAAIRTLAEWAAVTARAREGPDCLDFVYSREGQWLSRNEVTRHENTVKQWTQEDEVSLEPLHT